MLETVILAIVLIFLQTRFPDVDTFTGMEVSFKNLPEYLNYLVRFILNPTWFGYNFTIGKRNNNRRKGCLINGTKKGKEEGKKSLKVFFGGGMIL